MFLKNRMPQHKHPIEDIMYIITYEEWRSKTKEKRKEIELRFNLPTKELYLLVVYLRVLKLSEEFLNLLWLHLNIHSGFVFFFSPEYVPQQGTGDSRRC